MASARLILDVPALTETVDLLGRLACQMDDIANRLARIERRQQLEQALANTTEEPMSDTEPTTPDPEPVEPVEPEPDAEPEPDV